MGPGFIAIEIRGTDIAAVINDDKGQRRRFA
jgi:hypothetical protein